MGEMLRLAVMVTNWPATPLPVQELPQVLAPPQLLSSAATPTRAIAAGCVVAVVDIDSARRPACPEGIVDDCRDIGRERTGIGRDHGGVVFGVLGASAHRRIEFRCGVDQ